MIPESIDRFPYRSDFLVDLFIGPSDSDRLFTIFVQVAALSWERQYSKQMPRWTKWFRLSIKFGYYAV